MSKLMITNIENGRSKVTDARSQPVVIWLHFLNFVTIAILCFLFLKIYKTFLLLNEWLFPFKQISECPIILVLGPKNNIIQEIILQLSQTFNSDIIVFQERNGDSLEKYAKPKKNFQKGQIICSHEPISSQNVIFELRKRVQKTFGFVDVLVISQKEDNLEENSSAHSFLNHLNKQLLVQFWAVMAFLPGMLRRNKGHILSVALGRTSLTNTGIMRAVHEELLQCDTNVKLILVERNAVLDKHYLPALPPNMLASLIVRSIWKSSSVVRVPSLPYYLIILPVLIVRALLKSITKIINFTSVSSLRSFYYNKHEN